GGPLLNDFGHSLSYRSSNFRGEHALAFFRCPFEQGLVGSPTGEMHFGEACRRPAHPIVDQNTDKFSERYGTIRRTADGGGVGRNHSLKGKAEALPIRRHPVKGVSFYADAQAQILGPAIVAIE